MKNTMTREEVSDKLIQIIRANLVGFEDKEIKDEAIINTEAALDSMTFTYVMCKIEAQFDIKIPTKKWAKLQTFGDLVDAVTKALK